MSANGAVLPQATDREVWRVVHFCAKGPLGETLLDPVHAELLFLAKWRPHLPLRFEESRYPTVAALGPLPVLVTKEGIVSREDLRSALAALDPDGYGANFNESFDESFACLLDRLGLLTSVLLYEDKVVWETYTRPTLTRSSPPGFGWAAAMAEQRRQAVRLHEAQFFHEPLSTAAVLAELRSVLEAVSDRLHANGSLSAGSPELSSLDARTYAQLVVLLSIPCSGSGLEKVLADFPALSRYVGCIEERLPGTWPDYSSFLQALSPDERPPPPPMSTFQSKAAVAVETKLRRQEWWEIWGWSWGGRKRPVQFSGPGKAPEAVYAIGFGIVSGLSFVVAILCGLGPNKPLAALRQMLLADEASE